MRRRADAGNVDERAQSIGGMRDGHQARAGSQLGGHRVDAEPTAGVSVEFGEPDGDTALAGGDHPRPDIGVVIEAGQDDLVPLGPGSGHRPADGERDAGHVLAKRDLLWPRGVEEVCHRPSRGVG